MILKIVGIAIAVVLGVILTVLLIVLLTPFRYRIYGSYKDAPQGTVQFHFWFRAVEAKVTFADMVLDAKLRLLFIKKALFHKDFKEKEEAAQSEAMTPQEEAALDEMLEPLDFEAFDEPEETTSEASAGGTPLPMEKIPEEEEEARVAELLERAQESMREQGVDPAQVLQDDAEAEPAETAETPQESFTFEKKKDLEDRLDELLQSLEQKVEGVEGKVSEIQAKVTSITDILQKDTTKAALVYLLKKVGKILKRFLPRTYWGYLRIGLDSPATMGMLAGYGAMLYPFYKDNFRFEPVFDEQVIEGELDLRGKIVLMPIVITLIPVLFNRNVRAVWRDIKSLKVANQS